MGFKSSHLKLHPSEFTHNFGLSYLYNPGIAMLTVSSLLDGVFEIAGTSSPYTGIMRAAAILFIAAAIVCQTVYAVRTIKKQK